MNKSLYVKKRLFNIYDNDQMEAIKKGFYEIIPLRLLKNFNEFDLDVNIHRLE